MKTRALSSALVAIGLFGALPGAEAATINVANLNDSGYTAIVRGAGGTTGIAVVEVYALN